MEENYQGWRYEAKFEGNQLVFKVKPSLELKSDKFFKYYSLSNNSVDALTNCYVYASHPNQFNDSFDCNSQILSFEKATKGDIQGLYANLYSQYLEIYGSEEALRERASDDFKELFCRHVGFVSLTSRNDNTHLWHVYSQDSQGFCVELNVDKFPFKCYGPHPIQYVDKLSQFDVNKNVPTALLIQTNVKTKDWEMEEEWRVLVSNPEGFDFNSWETDGSLSERYNLGDEHDRKMKYPFGAIKSITLGERFFRSPNIRCCQISNEEKEYVFVNDDEEMRVKVLDFLIGKPFELSLIKNDMGELIPMPIEIVKLQSKVYRIIFKKLKFRK